MKLTFRETLRGYVAPAVDHATGFAQGRRSGKALSFQALATIEDLDAFESDPQHSVTLEGEVDYAPLGRGLLMRDAVIHLFVPGPQGRLLRYRIPFEADGRGYLLLGEKRIGRWPSFRAMTTLYAELFEETRGADARTAAKPLARGQLRVPFTEAIRFPFTLRVPGYALVSSLRPALRFLWFSRRQLTAP